MPHLLDWVFDGSFVINIVLNAFFLLPPGRPDAHRLAILAAYARGSLLEDLASGPPWDDVAALLGAGVRTQFACGMLRALRIRTVLDAFRITEEDVDLPYEVVRLLKFTLLLMVQSHVFACIMYFLATRQDAPGESYLFRACVAKFGHAPTGLLGKYVVSLYFSVTTLATVGYGDVSAVTLPEARAPLRAAADRRAADAPPPPHARALCARR